MGRLNYTSKGAKQYAAQATSASRGGPNSGGGRSTGGGATTPRLRPATCVIGNCGTPIPGRTVQVGPIPPCPRGNPLYDCGRHCRDCTGLVQEADRGKCRFCNACRCPTHTQTGCRESRYCGIPHFCQGCRKPTGASSFSAAKFCQECRCVDRNCHKCRFTCFQHNSVPCATAGCVGTSVVPSAFCDGCKCTQCNKSKAECFQHNIVLCCACKVNLTSRVGRTLCDDCRCEECSVEILKSKCWQHNVVECRNCKLANTPYPGVKYCDECACRDCATETLKRDCYDHYTHGCECRHETSVLGFKYGRRCKCAKEDCPNRRGGAHGFCVGHARCNEPHCSQQTVLHPYRLPYCEEHCCPRRLCDERLGQCEHSCKTLVGKNKPCTHPRLEAPDVHGHPPDGFHCEEHLMCDSCQELVSQCICDRGT